MNKLNTNQQIAVDQVLEGHNVFLTGAAGTGKSFLLKQLIKHVRRIHTDYESVAVVAPSGIAASLIHGNTIHSQFRIPLDLKSPPKKNTIWQSLVVVIIDEVSMVSPSLFEYLNRQAQISKDTQDQPFGGVQLVLCGDFFQLPPVIRNSRQDQKNNAQFIFQTVVWRQLLVKTVVLQTVYRQNQDEEFLRCLNELRTGEISVSTHLFMQKLMKKRPPRQKIVTTQLCTHRHQVDQINGDSLQRLLGPAHTYENHVQLHEAPNRCISSKQTLAIFKSILPNKLLTLKKQMRVMVVFNLKLPSIRLTNGTLGTVVGFETKTWYNFPIVRFLHVTMVIRPLTWIITHANRKIKLLCIPLVPAFGLTIHKCQGCSLDGDVVIDISKVFAPHMIYVALSRVTDQKYIYLRGWKDNQLVSIHPAVRQFYKSLV